MITVLIVDDQEPVRAGLRMRLELEPDLRVVGEAADGLAALELAGRLRPDVVLMDAFLPRMDGISAADALREKAPGAATVILSIRGDAATRERARAAGAVAYLEKREGEKALLAAIRRAGIAR